MAEKVFDSETLTQLKAMRLALRRAMAGDAGAAHPSRGVGGRFEFRDHRDYAHGDDFRNIDWNLYGRLGELFVKRFRSDTDVEILVVIDRSASMTVGRPAKDVFCRRVAAGLAFGLAGDGRVVHVTSLGDVATPVGGGVRSEADCAALVAALESLAPPRGRADLTAVRPLLRSSGRTRIVYVLSDFLDASPLATSLRAAPSRRTHPVLASVLAHEERAPAVSRGVDLVGIEGEGVLVGALDAAALARYAEVLEVHQADLRDYARGHRMGWVELGAEMPLDRALVTLSRAGVEA